MPEPGNRPKYRAVADDLRSLVMSGQLPAGSLIPTEPALMERYDASRGTVRQAIAQLRAEGLIITEHGRGSYVRPQLPLRRLGSERYRVEIGQRDGASTPATSFTADQAIPWSAYRLDREFREVPATAALAELFEAAVATMLLERRFVFYSQERPQQMSYSYLLLDMVAGTPVADPTNEPWPGGNIAQLATLGVRVTAVRERIRARMPLSEESELLEIAPGVPVLTLTRRMFAGERVVEAAVDIVIPADRVELEYEIDLT